MKSDKIKILLPLILLILTPFLMGDMGPKPRAEFEIVYDIDPSPQLTGYALYFCDTVDCHDTYSMEDLGPQHFDCTQDSCSSMAYSYNEFMYITFDFADGTSLTSNIFTKEHFNAEYEIRVGADSLEVTETGGSGSGISAWGAMIYTIIGLYVCIGVVIVTVIVLIIVFIVRRLRNKQAIAK